MVTEVVIEGFSVRSAALRSVAAQPPYRLLGLGISFASLLGFLRIFLPGRGIFPASINVCKSSSSPFVHVIPVYVNEINNPDVMNSFLAFKEPHLCHSSGL